MAMSWRFTLVLVALWALGIAALLWAQRTGPRRDVPRERAILEDLPRDIEWFEIRRPGRASFRVQQVPFGEAGRYLVVDPFAELARGDRITSLSFALKAIETRFRADRTPDAQTLRELELDPARLEIELAVAGGKKYLIRVGRRDPILKDAYVTVDSHPGLVFLLSEANADALELTLDDRDTGIVNRQLLWVEESAVRAIEIAVRLHGARGDPYDRRRAALDPQRGGWVVEAPADMRGERLDDVKVRTMIGNVRDIQAEELIRRGGDREALLREFGLDEPAFVLKLELHGERPPIEVRFQAREPKPRDPGECFAWNSAYPERVCRIPRDAYYRRTVPRAWTELLPPVLFSFAGSRIRRVRVVRTRGDEVRELEIADISTGADPAQLWRVLKPEEVAGTSSRDIQQYLSILLTGAQVQEVVPGADNLAAFGLDQPELRIEFLVSHPDGTTEGHAYRFTREGSSVRAYREGAGYWVLLKTGDPDWYSSVRMVDRPLRGTRYLAVEPGALRRVEVEGQVWAFDSFLPRRWAVQYDRSRMTWSRAEGWESPAEVDRDRMAELENQLVAFGARSLETDDPADFPRFGLGPDDPVLRVRLEYEDRSGARAEAVFRVAAPRSGRCYAEFGGAVVGFPEELGKLLADGVGVPGRR